MRPTLLLKRERGEEGSGKKKKKRVNVMEEDSESWLVKIEPFYFDPCKQVLLIRESQRDF